jgi:nitroreductase
MIVGRLGRNKNRSPNQRQEILMAQPSSLEQLKHGVTESPVEELLLRRWSPRAFSEKPISDADLKTIFTAAAWAASSFNEQPWRFVLGRRGDETHKKIFDSLMPPNQMWTKPVPVLVASFAKKTFSHNKNPNSVAQNDVGAASANLALQATALGMHAHGMAGFDKAALHAALQVPDEFEPVACWAIGYLGDPESLPEHFKKMEGEPRKRKPLAEFVYKSWEKPAL